MSETTAQTDVVILGAGPVGLTVANELRRRGVGVRIFDKGPAIREISKALIWHVRTQEALDKVGILGKGLAEALPLKEVVVHAYGKHIGSWHLDRMDSPYPSPLIIGQNRTQHLLKDHLSSQGTEVEWNSEATALEVSEDSVALTVRHTDPASSVATDATVRAGYVVGCEGSNSLVRKTLGLTFEGERYSGEQFIQADCKIRWTLPAGRSYLFLTSDGYVMVIEMPGGIVRIFLSLPDPTATSASATSVTGQQEAAHSLGAAEDISNTPTLDEIRENFTRLTGLGVELSDPTWLARYRTSHRYANVFRIGRAFIAGDAGHVHVPIGGQGMNTGIQDGFNLGWKLAGVIHGTYQAAILDTYNAERHPVAEGLIKGTDIAYRGVLHPSEVQQRAARWFGPFVMRQEPVQQFVRNTLEELTISYNNTPLNRDCGGSSGPKPGERVLDAPAVRWSDRATITVFDLAREAEWLLFLFGGYPPTSDYASFAALAAEIGGRYAPTVQPHLVLADAALPPYLPFTASILMDAECYLHDKYGVTHPALYLLRPDGFVGFRGTMNDGEELKEYLAGIFTQ